MPDDRLSDTDGLLTGTRLAGSIESSLAALGPLQELVGTWKGAGFNAIWRPHFESGSPNLDDPAFPVDHFLMLNLTRETLAFNLVSTAVPNRGLTEEDIPLAVLHYLQRISDANSSPGIGAIHFEPGLWANVPATKDTGNEATVNRMAAIPHGNAVLAEGRAFTAPAPVIQDINIIPFTIGTPAAQNPFPELDLSNAPLPSRNDPLPTGAGNPAVIPPTPGGDPFVSLQNLVNNPNALLQERITGLQSIGFDIVGTTVLEVSTAGAAPLNTGGIDSIPFLNAASSANIAQMTATFWITLFRHARIAHREFSLLQYSQVVFLNFNDLTWPHVSVANLFKAF
jgi:hypothetical protein